MNYKIIEKLEIVKFWTYHLLLLMIRFVYVNRYICNSNYYCTNRVNKLQWPLLDTAPTQYHLHCCPSKIYIKVVDKIWLKKNKICFKIVQHSLFFSTLIKIFRVEVTLLFLFLPVTKPEGECAFGIALLECAIKHGKEVSAI